MTQYVGLDVSLKETKVHVLDEAGNRVWRGRCATEPAAIAAAVRRYAPNAMRIGVETGPLTTWLWTALTAEGLPMVCRQEWRSTSRSTKPTPDDRRVGRQAAPLPTWRYMMQRSPGRIVPRGVDNEPNFVRTPREDLRKKLFNQRARLPEYLLYLPMLFDSFTRISAVLQSIFIATRSTRSRRAAMHATTISAADCRSPARFT